MNSTAAAPLDPLQRSPAWTRWLCLVLLCATLLNYANRFAFSQNSSQVQAAFQTDQEGYGDVSSKFSIGFALGLLLFGFLADKFSVRWLYPAVVLAWSAASISTGMVTTLGGVAASQFFLGLFEAGHWPCALRTTQRLFKPDQRTWGNSLLQSGASLGAVGTPLLIAALYEWDPSQWRWIFLLVGCLGLPWAIAWLMSVREADLLRPVIQTNETSAGPGEDQQLQEQPFLSIFLSRRWWLLLLVVNLINLLWHYVRVWLPDTLEADHGYHHAFVQYFTSVYYLCTFLGSLACGFITARLAARGWNVHRARLATFLLFALLSSAATVAAFLPKGPLLLGALLVTAFGSLGLYPIYYSLNQELSARNQGKVGGSLGFSTWGMLSIVHYWVGYLVKQNPDIRPWLMAAVGLGPLLAFAVLALFWGRRAPAEER